MNVEGVASDSGAFARLRESVSFRLAVPAGLVLLLQIPIALIDGTIAERRTTRNAAFAEVSATWGGAQQLVGPVLTVPVVEPSANGPETVAPRRFFPRTPQSWGLHCFVFLLRRAGHGRAAEFHFFLVPHDLFTAHLHGLNPNYLVAHDPDEIYILGWLTVNPVFIVGLTIFLAYLFRWTAFGINHHFTIHTYQYLVILYCLFDLRGHRLEIRLNRRFGVKIEYRPQHLLNLLHCEIGNVVI